MLVKVRSSETNICWSIITHCPNQNSGLNFDPGLALIVLWTTGPISTTIQDAGQLGHIYNDFSQNISSTKKYLKNL
jgi:hypothetical protein